MCGIRLGVSTLRTGSRESLPNTVITVTLHTSLQGRADQVRDLTVPLRYVLGQETCLLK